VEQPGGRDPVSCQEIVFLKSTESAALRDYTTLRLGGVAARLVTAATDEQLVSVVRAADAAAEPVLVLGGGSNLVVADEGFPGTVVRVASAGVQLVRDRGSVEATVAAGEDWDGLVQRCIAEGLSGIECLSGIPGLTGATPIQNVGAYGQEVAQTVEAVRVYDRLRDEILAMPAADCCFDYRTSVFKRRATMGPGAALNPASATGRWVVLSVRLRLAADRLSAPVRYAELAKVLDVAEGCRVPLAEARAAVLGLRRGKGMVLDPADPDTRSAGSFFTNPIVPATQFASLQATVEAPIPHWPAADEQVKLSAAWLIEHSGFGKGFRLSDDPDGARISTKHTLALTNPGNATTAGLVRLARGVRDGVLRQFGVELANEPVLVGVEL